MSLCSLQAGPHSWHHEDGHHIGCAVTRGGQGSQQHAPEGQWRAISRTLAMITPRSCHCANRHKPIPDIIMGITWTSSETVSTECTIGNFEGPGRLIPNENTPLILHIEVQNYHKRTYFSSLSIYPPGPHNFFFVHCWECHPGCGQTSCDVGELEIQILIGLNGFLFH